MLKKLTMLAPLVLGACSSVGTLRAEGPRSQFSSEKSVDDVVTCIVDAWSHKRVNVSVLPTQGGKTVQVNSDAGPPVMFVDVTSASPTGAVAKIYSQAGDGGWFAKTAQQCH